MCITEINLPIQNREMGGQFSMHMWTSITVGFIFAFPFMLWEIWKFISPALYENEKKICCFIYYSFIHFVLYWCFIWLLFNSTIICSILLQVIL